MIKLKEVTEDEIFELCFEILKKSTDIRIDYFQDDSLEGIWGDGNGINVYLATKTIYRNGTNKEHNPEKEELLKLLDKSLFKEVGIYPKNGEEIDKNRYVVQESGKQYLIIGG